MPDLESFITPSPPPPTPTTATATTTATTTTTTIATTTATTTATTAATTTATATTASTTAATTTKPRVSDVKETRKHFQKLHFRSVIKRGPLSFVRKRLFGLFCSKIILPCLEI